MRMIAKKQWLGFAVVAALTTVPIMACSSSSSSGSSSSFTCGAASKCTNDPPQTADVTSLCQQELNGPCAQEYQAYGDCVLTNQKCDSDDKTDNASIASCASPQLSTLTACEQAHADAGTD